MRQFIKVLHVPLNRFTAQDYSPKPFIAFLRMLASFSALKFLAGLRVGSS